jgi:hypothetical protein
MRFREGWKCWYMLVNNLAVIATIFTSLISPTVHLNGRLACFTPCKCYTVVHRFCLISRLAHLNGRFALSIGRLGRIMAKRRVTDCLPFSI